MPVSATCISCSKWPAESLEEKVCRACRLSLAVTRSCSQSSCKEEDFEWVCEELTRLLGNFSSRLLLGGPKGPPQEAKEPPQKGESATGSGKKEESHKPPAEDISRSPSRRRRRRARRDRKSERDGSDPRRGRKVSRGSPGTKGDNTRKRGKEPVSPSRSPSAKRTAEKPSKKERKASPPKVPKEEPPSGRRKDKRESRDDSRESPPGPKKARTPESRRSDSRTPEPEEARSSTWRPTLRGATRLEPRKEARRDRSPTPDPRPPREPRTPEEPPRGRVPEPREGPPVEGYPGWWNPAESNPWYPAYSPQLLGGKGHHKGYPSQGGYWWGNPFSPWQSWGGSDTKKKKKNKGKNRPDWYKENVLDRKGKGKGNKGKKGASSGAPEGDPTSTPPGVAPEEGAGETGEEAEGASERDRVNRWADAAEEDSEASGR